RVVEKHEDIARALERRGRPGLFDDRPRYAAAAAEHRGHQQPNAAAKQGRGIESQSKHDVIFLLGRADRKRTHPREQGDARAGADTAPRSPCPSPCPAFLIGHGHVLGLERFARWHGAGGENAFGALSDLLAATSRSKGDSRTNRWSARCVAEV